MDKPISTFIINLSHRTDRRDYILREFSRFDEFEITIVDAIAHEIGGVGLWLTIRNIVKLAKLQKEEYILVCEDDHLFTENYSKEFLYENIALAQTKRADILLGGVSSVRSIFTISQSLLWIEGYTGNQFIIVFSNFFQAIIDADFKNDDVAEFKISSITSNQFLIYPFISIQKEFGYSDATPRNSEIGRVSELFSASSNTIQYILEREAFYGFENGALEDHQHETDYENVVIPTYVINRPGRVGGMIHIQEQFYGKSEFDVVYIQACGEDIGSVGLWKSMREAIQMGVDNDDDALIICEDDHVFSDDYNKRGFLRNIIEAHQQGADILSGGTSGGFGHALPLTGSRFWVNHLLSNQFIVIYRKFFQKIVNAPFNDEITVYDFLSGLTSNKMLLFPYISSQKIFDYSKATPHNEVEGLATKMFSASSNRLSMIQKAYNKNRGYL